MKIHHLRSATLILQLGAHHLLVDPMLGAPGAMPGFKLFGGGRRRNPLVPLPPTTEAALAEVTGVLITHEHPDHLDAPAVDWIRGRGLPVWASGTDVPSLRRRGLDARELGDGALGLAVEVIPTRHGRGALGWLMGPVAGLYLSHPDEPSVYLTSDAVLTDSVLDVLSRLRPDVVVAPAGAASFGIGPPILFSVDELVALAQRAPGAVVLNHLEALDHCPTTRSDLRQRIAAAGLAARVHIPDDGDTLTFTQRTAPIRPRVRSPLRPGFQKWLTAKLG